MREAIIRHETGYPTARQDFASELDSLIRRIQETPFGQCVAPYGGALAAKGVTAVPVRPPAGGQCAGTMSHHSRKPGYWLARL